MGQKGSVFKAALFTFLFMQLNVFLVDTESFSTLFQATGLQPFALKCGLFEARGHDKRSSWLVTAGSMSKNHQCESYLEIRWFHYEIKKEMQYVFNPSNTSCISTALNIQISTRTMKSTSCLLGISLYFCSYCISQQCPDFIKSCFMFRSCYCRRINVEI